MAEQPLRVLAVCTGNICRSPAMELLLQRAWSSGVIVESAGTHGLVGRPIQPTMGALLAADGVDSCRFIARRLTSAMATSADLVLTATTEHRSSVLREAPGALHKTFTLLEASDLIRRKIDDLHEVASPREAVATLAASRSLRRKSRGADDVADPYGGSDEDYAQAYAAISASVATLAEIAHLFAHRV